jgi:hypothetical protein
MLGRTFFRIGEAAPALCLTLALLIPFAATPARGQRKQNRNLREVEPNVYAPQLYADRLKLKLTLINLPGAPDPRSTWEASYQIYFIPESNFQSVLRSAPSGGWNPSPADFPGRILLGEGRIRRTSLRTLAERIHLSRGLALKSRVPDKMRTKFATIMTSYSVKIYDARLDSTVYRSGTFVAKPFADDEGARTTLYANFYVSPTGQLFYSQRPRNSDATTWP